MKNPTFYEKLCNRRHIGLDGSTTYETRPAKMVGGIECIHQGHAPVVIFLVSIIATGRITLYNMTTREELETFKLADNVCAEELHKEIELLSRPKAA